ncbi:winged helix-turn-helix transcriptional regulator [Arcanobacterium phocisimile]|uniref:Winged helix-turn-helix transcriptional regulator n=1 Tax=Arcanobacterium phocisimile TaxID=1302235 RepID=A0ABX7IJF6_9ACTO|nr:MarR family winged helix-turn-helix transcriptional regulator [Arcanobacterium phocisimile]QRV01973.1 winged helix-turn-helix transcriptional regulator [Arcanobacterium phocisimile]
MTDPTPLDTPIRDEVDEVIAQWLVQRPELDTDPLEVFSRLIRLTRHVERMRKTVFARNALESWEFDMLTALRRQPDHTLTAGQLMKETLVSSGTVTNRLDRMARKGLLERHTDERDGRIVHVKATALGIERADAAFADLLSVEADILTMFKLEDNAQAAAYMRRLLCYFEQ